MSKQRVTTCTAEWGVEVRVYSDGFHLIVQDEKHCIRIKMNDGALHELVYGMRKLVEARQKTVDNLNASLKGN